MLADSLECLHFSLLDDDARSHVLEEAKRLRIINEHYLLHLDQDNDSHNQGNATNEILSVVKKAERMSRNYQ